MSTKTIRYCELQSDKVFWHGYLDFYETFFTNREFRNIAEFGIFKGDSIRWLLKRFPGARIHGADIIPLQPSWPVSENFRFHQLDQGNTAQIRQFLSHSTFDLIIEDGSHIPKHQSTCLVEGMRSLKAGGIYILEDIHTSLRDQSTSNSLNLLLAIDHYKRTGMSFDETAAQHVSKGSFFSPEEALEIAANCQAISLYRRTHLPDRCWNCGTQDFNYSKLKCSCGVDLYDIDSMSFVIEKKKDLRV